MKPQEAIKFLYFSKDHWEEASPVAKAHEFAIKALEKQIPKKPTNQRLASGIIGDNGIMQGECPCCGENVIGNYYGEYCGCCGQAIDWSE